MPKGISIIEILIVIAIINIALISLFGIVSYSLKISTSIRETTQGNFLAQEAMEAVRNFRDGTNWSGDGLGALDTGETNPYHPEKSGSPLRWLLISGSETIDGFTRKIIFEKVSRNGSDNIEEIYNPANDDPDTRKVTVIVSWKDREVKLVTYLTNWK